MPNVSGQICSGPKIDGCDYLAHRFFLAFPATHAGKAYVIVVPERRFPQFCLLSAMVHPVRNFRVDPTVSLETHHIIFKSPAPSAP